MELMQDEKGFYWVHGYATSQSFASEAEANAAREREEAEMGRLGLAPDSLASAGILEWTY